MTSHEVPGESSIAAIRWLIIDDDVIFAATIARGLQRHGHLCVLAHDGATARRLAEETQPSRVLLDMRLGKESGLALLPDLRAALPDANIVVLTGFASIATAVRAVKSGANDYLPKPILLRDLLAHFSATTSSEVRSDMSDDAMSPRRIAWEHIQRVLGDCDGNVSAAARRLGMHRRTLQRTLAKRPTAR